MVQSELLNGHQLGRNHLVLVSKVLPSFCVTTTPHGEQGKEIADTNTKSNTKSNLADFSQATAHIQPQARDPWCPANDTADHTVLEGGGGASSNEHSARRKPGVGPFARPEPQPLHASSPAAKRRLLNSRPQLSRTRTFWHEPKYLPPHIEWEGWLGLQFQSSNLNQGEMEKRHGIPGLPPASSIFKGIGIDLPSHVATAPDKGSGLIKWKLIFPVLHKCLLFVGGRVPKGVTGRNIMSKVGLIHMS